MIKNIVFILIILTMLFGCSQQSYRESYPSNISFANDMLTWDAIDDATAYIVLINQNDSYQVTENHFDTTLLKNGAYAVEVQSVFKTSQSTYSRAYFFTISRDYQMVSDVEITENMITWSKVTDAMSYTVLLNGTPFTVSDTYILLEALNMSINEMYAIIVYATFPSGDQTPHTQTIGYPNYIKQAQKLYTTVELDAQSYFTIDLPDQAFLNDYILLPDHPSTQVHYIAHHHSVSIATSTFNFLGIGTYTLELYTDQGLYLLELDLIEPGTSPMMVTDSTVDYVKGVPLVFEFNLNGGTFDGLTRYGIESSDYTFIDQRLTISESFVESLIQEHPDLDTLTFAYVMSKGNHIYTKFIIIHLGS